MFLSPILILITVHLFCSIGVFILIKSCFWNKNIPSGYQKKNWQLLCSKCFNTIYELRFSTTHEQEAASSTFSVEKLPWKISLMTECLSNLKVSSCRFATLLKTYFIMSVFRIILWNFRTDLTDCISLFALSN